MTSLRCPKAMVMAVRPKRATSTGSVVVPAVYARMTISAVSATLTTPGKWFFNKYLPVLACTAAACLYAWMPSSSASCLYNYALRNAPLARGDMNIT